MDPADGLAQLHGGEDGTAPMVGGGLWVERRKSETIRKTVIST